MHMGGYVCTAKCTNTRVSVSSPLASTCPGGVRGWPSPSGLAITPAGREPSDWVCRSSGDGEFSVPLCRAGRHTGPPLAWGSRGEGVG